jgi:hypothetical protein
MKPHFTLAMDIALLLLFAATMTEIGMALGYLYR